VAEIFNADSYIWKLPEHASGTSTGNSIQVLFDNGFTTGSISVSASSQGFGSSASDSKTITLNGASIDNEKAEKLEINVFRNGFQNYVLEILSESTDDFQIEIYTIDGRMVYTKRIRSWGGIVQQLQLPVSSGNLYFVSITGKHGEKLKTIFIK
jgi:hypothetical protein